MRGWSGRHSTILISLAGRKYDQEIVDEIAAITGDRFSRLTVAARRRSLGLPGCRRNDWTRALRRALQIERAGQVA